MDTVSDTSAQRFVDRLVIEPLRILADPEENKSHAQVRSTLQGATKADLTRLLGKVSPAYQAKLTKIIGLLGTKLTDPKSTISAIIEI